MNSDLITALLQDDSFPHPCQEIELVETHISWIILTGDYAYKIKKPVDFGFLDFTTLARRKQYCDAELSLNSRSAPEIYLGLVAISRSDNNAIVLHDTFNADGTPNASSGILEYAIKMNQFKKGHLFSELIADNHLTFDHIDELADSIARFHKQAAVADTASAFGTPAQLFIPVEQNFAQIHERLETEDQRQQLAYLQAWSFSTFERLTPFIEQRKCQGKTREGHGDMHCGNLTLYRDRVTLFDCIEFNDAFRWIDLISDVAFLVMDLEERGETPFANRFINHYLEETGDYEGLTLLPFYKAYRAVVRAKISLFEMDSFRDQPDQIARLWRKYQSYIDLAESYTGLPNRFSLIMHGVSGTGKSTVALRLVDQLGVIRIRSDVERKRLYDIDAHHHPDMAMRQTLYSDDATQRTYKTLASLSATILDAGLSVVVDATNLMRWQRSAIEAVSDQRAVPTYIADCQAEIGQITEWIHQREDEDENVSDAGIDVVNRQVKQQDPLTEAELRQTFALHSQVIEETRALANKIQKRFL